MAPEEPGNESLPERKEVLERDKERLIEHYTTGDLTLSQAARIYSVSKAVMRQFLVSNGVRIRNRSEAARVRVGIVLHSQDPSST